VPDPDEIGISTREVTLVLVQLQAMGKFFGIPQATIDVVLAAAKADMEGK